jgi:hypothetical protein
LIGILSEDGDLEELAAWVAEKKTGLSDIESHLP